MLAPVLMRSFHSTDETFKDGPLREVLDTKIVHEILSHCCEQISSDRWRSDESIPPPLWVGIANTSIPGSVLASLR